MSAEQIITLLFRGLMVAHVVTDEETQRDFFEIGVFTDAPAHEFRINTLNAALPLGEDPVASFALDDLVGAGRPRLWRIEVDDPAQQGISLLHTAPDPFDRIALAGDDSASEDFRWIIDLEDDDFYPQGVRGVLDTARLTPVLRVPYGELFTAELSPFLGRKRDNGQLERFGLVAGSTGCRIRVRSGGVRLVNEAGTIFNFENNPGFLYEFANTPPEVSANDGEPHDHADEGEPHDDHAAGHGTGHGGGHGHGAGGKFFDHFPLYYELFPAVLPRGFARFAFDEIKSAAGVGAGARPQLCGGVYTSRTRESFIEAGGAEDEPAGDGGSGGEESDGGDESSGGRESSGGDESSGDSDGGTSEGAAAKAELMEVDETGMGRFPDDQLTGPAASSWVAGLVEVELAEGAGPELFSHDSAALADVEAAPESGVGTLKRALLERFESVRLEPSARSGGRARRARIVTLRFANDLDAQRAAEDMARLPQVKRAVSVPKAAPASTPHNEPLVRTDVTVLDGSLAGIKSQWYIGRCGVDAAWERQLSGRGVVVAVIDWGFRTTHQDFGPRIERRFNSIDLSENVSAGERSHGTAVLGLAGAHDNGLGMAGVAYGASYWAIQGGNALNDVGPRSWVDAINFVRDANGGDPRRKVIVLATQTARHGNYEMIPSVNQAIRDAIADNIVVCVAAGNGDRDAGLDETGQPFDPTGSILVGATRFHPSANRRAAFSNFGERVVVSAPGDMLNDVTCSSHADFGYRNRFGGTSGAVSKVAGVAALMLEANPNLTHEQVRAILATPVTPVLSEPGKPVGTFLNADAAVRAALDSL